MKKKVINVDMFERGLFMIDNNVECDFCDEKKECACINTLHKDVMIICKECLQQFIIAFEK